MAEQHLDILQLIRIRLADGVVDALAGRFGLTGQAQCMENPPDGVLRILGVIDPTRNPLLGAPFLHDAQGHPLAKFVIRLAQPYPQREHQDLQWPAQGLDREVGHGRVEGGLDVVKRALQTPFDNIAHFLVIALLMPLFDRGRGVIETDQGISHATGKPLTPLEAAPERQQAHVRQHREGRCKA